MITEKDKVAIIKALKMVDVKKLELDHPDKKAVKWFRFGSYIGLDIATEVIKQLPNGKQPVQKVKKINVS